ncbi:MAG: NTP/NDP exchange transporter [Candidatus Binatia bacterium]
MSRERLSPFERGLRLFTDVRPGEGAIGLVLLAAVFLILASYYLIKPAREGFLAASAIEAFSDIELKAYSSFGQSLLLLLAIPLYDRLAERLTRRALVTWIPLFFVANLLLFWCAQPGLFLDNVPLVGIAFYLWVGIFNVFIVAQFWSFAADVYSDERGRRLFPMIAIGATAGAATGAGIADALVESAGVDAYSLLLGAALLLGASVLFLRIADGHGRDGGRNEPKHGAKAALAGALPLVFRHRLLTAVAFLILAVNWVNTNGENFLFGAVQEALRAEAAEQGLDAAATTRFLREETTAFYGDLFFWVNLVALVLQSFVASRLLKYGGFATILLLLPVISFVSYTAMALFPVLFVIRAMKIAENSTDYSIHNTAKQVLWLPTTTDMKFKAKAAIDTLFVRFGDGLAAATAFAGTKVLSLSLPTLFAVNAAIVIVWLVLGLVVVREHRRWSRKG